MTYLEAFVQVIKWIGYFIWAVIGLGGSFFFATDLLEEEKPYKYSAECLILCILSFIFFIAFIVYKISNR